MDVAKHKGTAWISDHRRLDERAFALHEAVAAKLENDPSLLAIAKANIDRWARRGVRSTYFTQWQRILDGPLSGVLEILRSTDENAVSLRQSSPFAGILSESERLAIHHAFAARAYHSRRR